MLVPRLHFSGLRNLIELVDATSFGATKNLEVSKLAIIFGAGASYDFLPTYPANDSYSNSLKQHRIPLANHLFQNRSDFADIAVKLRRLLPILPELRNRTGNRSVEEVLEELGALERDN